jgi:branched-chain amino acid transport system ATP-binding protein
MLSVEKINSWYGEAEALYNVSMMVKAEELVALFGRNGVGKSTTLRSIMGLKPPFCEGKIVFKGKNILGLPPYEIANKGIGFVPEDRRIFPNLTVKQNISTGIKIRGKNNKDIINKWDYDKIYQLFPKLEILKNSLGRNLSGGEQQMLTIARTLMGDPELLILDEPTEGLDPMRTKKIIDLITKLKKEHKMSILVVEQFSYEILDISDRCYVMDRGKIVFEGPSKEFKENKKLQQKLLGI